MSVLGFNDFGAGLGVDPSASQGGEADGANEGVPSAGPFGSGLFGRRTQAFATRPQLNSDNPVQDRIDALAAGRQRIQRSIDNPLRAYLKPRAWQEDVKSAAELDSALSQTKDAIQQQVDLNGKAAGWGIGRAEVAAMGPNKTQQTLINNQVQKLDEGSITAYRNIASLGDNGKSILAQHNYAFMPSLERNNAEAGDILDKLDAAAKEGPKTYADIVGKMKTEGRDPSKLLNEYVPGFTVPDRPDAWAVRSKMARGSLNAAQQMVSQYNTQQSNMGLGAPEADEKVAAAHQNSNFKGSKGGPIVGGTTWNLPSGNVGSIFQPGSVDPTKYGVKGGWNNATAADRKEIRDLSADPEVKGMLDKANAAEDYFKKATDDANYNDAAGVTTVFDGLSGLERNIIENSKGSANGNLVRQFKENVGPVDTILNKMQQARSSFDAALDSWVKGGKVGPQPRLNPATIAGLKRLATFQHDMTLREVESRLGPTLDAAGYKGMSPQDLPISETLQNSDYVKNRMGNGTQDFLRDYTRHQYVPKGSQAILLPEGTNEPGSQKFADPRDADQVKQDRNEAAQKERYANTVIRAESGGRPGQITGPYKGLGQFSDEEMARHGITNPDDPAQVKIALKKDYDSNKAAIQKATGIVPTDTQVYLAHQQGLGGIEAHLRNPDAPAWQNMASTAEGQRKGADWAKRAVWGNVPDDMKGLLAKNGVDVSNLTSNDFMRLWDAKFSHLGSEPNRATGSRKGFLGRLASLYTAPGQSVLTGNVNNIQPELNPDVQRARAGSGELPVTGSVAASTVGGALAGPLGGAIGGAAGGAGGQVAQNYATGKPLGEGVLREAGLGGAAGFVPGSRPVLGAIVRSVGAGGVAATNEALTNPDATPSSIVEKGVETGAAAAGGEAAFRVVGLALGRTGQLFNKFTDATKQELTDAGAVIAKGKPEAPKAAGAVPVSDTAKASHEAAVKAYDEAVQRAKDHGLDPEDLAHAVMQVPAGKVAVNKIVNAEKDALGARYQEISADVGKTGVGAPKQAPLSDGPLSLVGKHADVPKEYEGRAVQAENNITQPAKDWQEKYQQIFQERSKLLTEYREALPQGDAPNANKAAALKAIADNVGDQQRAMLNYVYGPRGKVMADKLDALHRDYAEFMSATKGGDIVENMAKPGVVGASATAAFNKYAKDDAGARQVAETLVAGIRNPKSDGGRNVRFMSALLASTLGLHLPAAAALLATDGPKMLNEWALRRAAGSPITFKALVTQQARQQVAKAKGNAAAAFGRGAAEAVQ